jgi:L-lactate dehydrogenase (cytochrome)
MRLAHAITVADLRGLARKNLPKAVFEFIDGGAHDEHTLSANTRDLAQIGLAPRVLTDVSQRSQAAEILGQAFSSPLVLGPTGLAGLLWPDGDIVTARATASAGVGYCLSTNSNCSIEQVAQRGRGDFWFQLYIQRDRAMVRSLVERAAAAGCQVLCVTVDLPIQGARERDERNGFTVPPRFDVRNVFDYASRIGWLWRMASGPAITFANLESAGAGKASLKTLVQHISEQFDQTVTWKDIDWLKSIWPGRMALKGILRPQDARLAVEHGVDAVIVSNHGGRQLDGAPSAISALSAIVEAKAMALGARGCLIGRAGLYGLASSGESGVTRAIEILRKEIDITLALLGEPDITKLDRSAILPKCFG